MYGEKLKTARKNAKLTLEQVAQIMNTTHATISRYENEKRKIEIETLKQFCIIYNISADYIIGLPEGMPYPKR